MKPQEVGGILQGPCFCFGTGVAVCTEVLRDMPGISSIDEGHDRISGETLIREGLRRRDLGQAGEAKPLYGRRSEAEIKFRIAAL